MASLTKRFCKVGAILSLTLLTKGLAFGITTVKIGDLVQVSDYYEFSLSIENTGANLSEKIDFENAKKFTLHFTNLSLPKTGDVYILILNSKFEEVDRIDSARLGDRTEFWTKAVTGERAIIVVKVDALPGADDAPVGLKIDKAGVQSLDTSAQLDSIIGDVQNPDYKYTYHYDDDDALMRAADAIAKIEFISGPEWGTCTGFLVSADLMVTNEHCISTSEIETCNSAKIYFGYEIIEVVTEQTGSHEYVESETETFECTEILHSSVESDWSIVRLNGMPGNEDKWGFLQVSFEDLVLPPDNSKTELLIIHHPAGFWKMITQDNCELKSVDVPGRVEDKLTDFGHSCDAVDGSSGSPVLNGDLHVVGSHHWGVIKDDPRWGDENRAVLSKNFCLPEEIQSEIPNWKKCDS